MRETALVANIRFTRASVEDHATGLLGWATCQFDERWQLDGLAVRRTTGGRYVLTFPARIDGNGFERPYLRPLSNELRAEIERRVLEDLRRKGVIR